MMMICPHCEVSGSLLLTTAVEISPVYVAHPEHERGPRLAGARMRLHPQASAMLTCRLCGWRVGGQLSDADTVGSTLRAGHFQATEDPVVPRART